MKPYTFFKHDGTNTPPVFDLAECRNDDEARAFALRLLNDSRHYEAVEVWDGVNESFTVQRQRSGAESGRAR